MNAKEKLEKAQRAYDEIVKHNKKQIDGLLAEIEARKASMLGYDDIQWKLDNMRAVAETGEKRALENLKKAEEAAGVVWEAEEAKRKADAEAIEVKQKRAALQSWTKSGGDPANFEGSWPSIREELLKKSVVDNMTKATEPTVRTL